MEQAAGAVADGAIRPREAEGASGRGPAQLRAAAAQRRVPRRRGRVLGRQDDGAGRAAGGARGPPPRAAAAAARPGPGPGPGHVGDSVRARRRGRRRRQRQRRTGRRGLGHGGGQRPRPPRLGAREDGCVEDVPSARGGGAPGAPRNVGVWRFDRGLSRGVQAFFVSPTERIKL